MNLSAYPTLITEYQIVRRNYPTLHPTLEPTLYPTLKPTLEGETWEQMRHSLGVNASFTGSKWPVYSEQAVCHH